MALADDTLGLEEAADMLRLGLEATRTLVDGGHIPAVRLNQKHTVILRDDVIGYIRDEGRRQAEERKKAATGKKRRVIPAARSAISAARKTTPPDLRAYETAST